MDLSMIAAPVIGAGIGYATNYIAVKMLFRPLKPIKIGNKTLPFTPGIIPKGKPRLASAIGDVVGTNLLSKETLKATFLTDSIKESVYQSILEFISNAKTETRSLDTCLSNHVSEDSMESLKNNITEFLSTSIETQLSAHPIGELISTEVIKAVKENLQGGLLGMFINDSLLQSVQVKITDGINGYLENHAKELVTPMITDELDQVMTQPISELAVHFDAYEEGIAKTLLSIYEHVIETKMDTILDKVNLKQIVEDQINNMDMLELEQLILSVMKKELNALVNLGAFIGFVLGLLNLLF